MHPSQPGDRAARIGSGSQFGNDCCGRSAVGQVGTCSLDTEIVELCDVQASGVSVPFLRVFTYDENGAVVSVENQDANGAPYAPNFSDLWGLHTGLLDINGQPKPALDAFDKHLKPFR